MPSLEILIRNISQICLYKEEKIAKKYSITRSELRTIRLYQKPGSKLKMKEISEKLKIRESRVTIIIDGLINKNLVERCQNFSDRRICKVLLTRKGQEIKKSIDLSCQTLWEKINSEINSKELKTIEKLESILSKYESQEI